MNTGVKRTYNQAPDFSAISFPGDGDDDILEYPAPAKKKTNKTRSTEKYFVLTSMSSIASSTLMLPNCSSNLDFGAASTLPISQASENSTVSQQLAVSMHLFQFMFNLIRHCCLVDLPFSVILVINIIRFLMLTSVS